MSAVAALAAERIKLVTTRAVLWAALGSAVLSLGVAALQGLGSYDYSSLPPQQAAVGVVLCGVPVLMILAALTVTAEYRTGTIHTTFLATPRRTVAMAAKAVVLALSCGGWAAVLALSAVLVARLTAGPPVAVQLPLTETATWRLIGGLAAYAALAAVLGVAVGMLLRSTAGAVAVLLLWPLVVEPILGNMLSVSRDLGPYLPFGNIFRFLDVAWLYPAYDMPWGELGSLVYFGVLVAAVSVIAVVVVNRRDA